MAKHLADILEDLFVIGLLACFISIFKSKLAGQPDMKLYGIPVKTAISIAYAGIAIFVILLVSKLLD